MSRSRLLLFLGVFLAIGVAGFLFNRYRVPPQLDFRELRLESLQGAAVSLSDFGNKMLLVNFFATWCGPCIQELPGLALAQKALAADSFVFIVISDEPIERLRSFQKRSQPRLVILHSIKPFFNETIYTLPTSFLLNRHGDVVYKSVGAQNFGSEEMLELLREKAKREN